MARRKPPFRTGTALPNASDLEKADTRLESAKAFVRDPAEAAEASMARETVAPDAPGTQLAAPEGRGVDTREEKKRPAETSAEGPPGLPIGNSGKKRNIRGTVVWLAEDMARFENLAEVTGTDVAYVQKAVVRNTGIRLRKLDERAAGRLAKDLRKDLQLKRSDGAGATEVNGYLTDAVLDALRQGVNDPFGLISDYRLVSTAFRLLGLQALEDLEKTTRL